MYIRSVHIENIRSIESFDMAFEEGHEAGWHVLIGENGSGKTTIARALAWILLGGIDHNALRIPGTFWLKENEKNGSISSIISLDQSFDQVRKFDKDDEDLQLNHGSLELIDFQQLVESGKTTHINLKPLEMHGHSVWTRDDKNVVTQKNKKFSFVPANETNANDLKLAATATIFNYVAHGCFISGFGPFRRFVGDSPGISTIFDSNPRLGAVLSIYSEEVALTKIVPWLKDLRFQELEDPEKTRTLSNVVDFINAAKLLPNGGKIIEVTREHIVCADGNGKAIDLYQLSDGYRSILSLTFELIRQLIRTYGEEKVFANIQKGEMNIPLPGVVIIDEVDAHLHPTWQTKIGQWFTQYFPQLQFIVTTHSPLICRACGEHGKIFKLAAPGSEKPSGEITGLNRDRLVYGDILEAYETDEFGDGVEWSDEGRKLQKEYRDLVYKRRFGLKMTKKEEERLGHLKGIFHSHVEAD